MIKYENSLQQHSSQLPWLLGGALVSVWFGVIFALAANGWFALPPGEPPVIMAAILGPPLVFLLALLSFPRLRAWALSLDPALLTALQGWRVLGGGFLMLYAFGHLPGFFAWPAGIGDVAVGLGAPFAAIALARGHLPLISNRFVAVHAAGLLDFVVAAGTGIAARNQIPGLVEGVTSSAMGDLPLVLIPAFAVPVFIILHLIVLLQVWQARSAGVTLAGAAAH